MKLCVWRSDRTWALIENRSLGSFGYEYFPDPQEQGGSDG